MLIEKVVLKVNGMSCNHCVNSIKKAVGDIDGVVSVEVSLEDKTVTVEYNTKKVKEGFVKVTIEDEGYTIG